LCPGREVRGKNFSRTQLCRDRITELIVPLNSATEDCTG
jgi:hypothetical protein